jgi:TM2 domain-containing membrane protein YozV
MKAALLSGLVLPGAGHMILKQYRRGWLLILIASIALSAMVTLVTRRAMPVVDRISSGGIPVDAESIQELVSGSVDNREDSMMTIVVITFGVCWLIGVVDSYRLGKAQER